MILSQSVHCSHFCIHVHGLFLCKIRIAHYLVRARSLLTLSDSGMTLVHRVHLNKLEATQAMDNSLKFLIAQPLSESDKCSW